MSTAEVTNLSNDLASVKSDMNVLSTQYREMKHLTGNMAQGINNMQSSQNRMEPIVEKLDELVQKLVEKVTGNQQFDQIGIIQILKNQEIINREVREALTILQKEEEIKGRFHKFFKKVGNWLIAVIGGLTFWIMDHVLPKFFHL
ncbi:hypothetical protein [uncultured Clostridium sp.]|uniref:flagellin N-terminal helical domain-containing protein n=1 Tax=uncultured Clostridium sp. TaxID=59620 RepID=UPI002624CEB2|nr:hypothetical protein [uncultured Clostridium sp.]